MDGFGGGEMSKNRKKRIEERMKGMLEITYFLAFQIKNSIYKEELETGATDPRFQMMIGSPSQVLNIKNYAKISNGSPSAFYNFPFCSKY